NPGYARERLGVSGQERGSLNGSTARGVHSIRPPLRAAHALRLQRVTRVARRGGGAPAPGGRLRESTFAPSQPTRTAHCHALSMESRHPRPRSARTPFGVSTPQQEHTANSLWSLDTPNEDALNPRGSLETLCEDTTCSVWGVETPDRGYRVL